ncbi:MAG TPA: IMP dehydrogenase [Actinoplanes sp.]|nr:IMP dehydrogenase [Actinoplanes sp.]
MAGLISTAAASNGHATRAGDTSIPLALSFDDVLLVPQRSAIRSRKLVDVSTDFLPGIRLAVPIVSANTQWCTGARMAIALARLGGLGFVHRMQTVDQQVAQVSEVRSAAAEGEVATADSAGTLQVGAAVGVSGDYAERADRLVTAGASALLVDVAHGHADYVIDVVRELKTRYPDVPLVAGNVATAAGTRDLAEAGADAVKVGIGPGGVCTTRLVAGSGVPQLSALLDCGQQARISGVPLIADGGIRTSGDIAKALAAGAAVVMAGSALAGADESEARPVRENGRQLKVSRGFATLGMDLTLKLAADQTVSAEEVERYVPEGVEMTFLPTGPLAGTVHQLVGGLRSAMTYSGAATLDDLRQRASFVRVTGAGRAENGPHARDRAPQLALDYRGEAARGE